MRVEGGLKKGWETIYVITAKKTKTVFSNGTLMFDAFSEVKDHKPTTEMC